MVNIFLSCSSKDHDFIKIIIDGLTALPDKYKLIYFLRPYNQDTPMEYILNKIGEADLFIIFISNNSLESEFVQSELEEAIKLFKLNEIKEICSIILDNSINVFEDYRIPEFIIKGNIFYSDSPENAVRIAEKFIFRY
ncbi:MAG: hypothetical protein K0R50_3550 [Eubacterium sp.]|nr:hypothetical protein [Eubacterium sp.]